MRHYYQLLNFIKKGWCFLPGWPRHLSRSGGGLLIRLEVTCCYALCLLFKTQTLTLQSAGNHLSSAVIQLQFYLLIVTSLNFNPEIKHSLYCCMCVWVRETELNLTDKCSSKMTFEWRMWFWKHIFCQPPTIKSNICLINECITICRS